MFINHEYPYHVLIQFAQKKGEHGERLVVCCGIFQVSLFYGRKGNFLLFFIMFGKYRLPRESFHEAVRESERSRKEQ